MKRIGIDIGGTKIKIGVIEGDNVTQSEIIDTPWDGLDSIAKVTTDKIKEMIGEDSNISAAGIGTRGTFKNGLLYDPVLHVEGESVEKAFNKYLPSFKIKVANDASVAAVSELKYGKLKGSKSGLFITLGTGIGGGIVLNEHLFEGANKNGGEIGHMLMNSYDIENYSLQSNTYESLASSKALVERTKKIFNETNDYKDSLILSECDNDLNKLDAKAIFDAYDKNDALAKELIDKHIEYIASGIINLIVAFDLDTIVIGGGISKRHEIIIPGIKKILEDKNISLLKNCEIVNATFLNEAGIIGAANLFDN